MDIEQFGCSKPCSRRRYATHHLLFLLAGNLLRTGFRKVEFGQMGVACPVDVEGHPD